MDVKNSLWTSSSQTHRCLCGETEHASMPSSQIHPTAFGRRRRGLAPTSGTPSRDTSQHVPSKVTYGLKDVLSDLLNFGARHLNLGGRLVFWMPFYNDDFREDSLPEHPCLKRIDCSQQPLSKHSSRLLLTMEKTTEPDETASAQISSAADSFRDRYFTGGKGRSGQSR
ncbi:unnamed protein product [Ixodes pacificus]